MVLRNQDWAYKELGWCKLALHMREGPLAFRTMMSALRSLRLALHMMEMVPHMIPQSLHRLGLVGSHTHPFLPHRLVLQVCKMAVACNWAWVCILALAYNGAEVYT